MMAAQLTHDWTLARLLAPWLALPPGQDRPLSGLALASGEVEPGMLFLALAGGSRHGLEFVEAALQRGAAAVLATPAAMPLWQQAARLCAARRVPLIELTALNQLASAIAGRFYGEPSEALAVVGVTGTDGKTSVSQFLAQALSEIEAPCGVIGTLGYGLAGALAAGGHTTPDAVRVQRLLAQMRADGARHVAMEVSSHALDQGRVAGVSFRVAVLTNLTRDHLDYHGNVEAYGEAKARLFHAAGLRCAVLNRDDAFGRRLQAELADRLPLLTYSLDPADPEAALVCDRLSLTSSGMRLALRHGEHAASVELPLLGRFNAANALATLGALLALELPFAEAVARLGRLRPVSGRMERLGGGEQPLVIVDYAHTPAALEAALKAVREHVPGRLHCVFGCGGDRDAGKRPQMAAAAERYADAVVVTDDNPRFEDGERIVADVLAGFGRLQPTVLRDRAAAIRAAVAAAAAGDAVLIAGKGHEQEQQIQGRCLPFDDRAVAARALQERHPCKK